MRRLTLNSKHLAWLVPLFWFHSTAQSYEIDTHEAISAWAASNSDNLDSNLANLGLSSLDDKLTTEGLKCRSEKPSNQSAIEWIQEGSVCEDDTVTETFARYRNHFYDPQHAGQGYTGFLWRDSGILRGMPAPDWAIDKGPADGQLYSFSQGRQYFYNALTMSTDAERKADLARMFRALGDVMHIVQDMAQPQHTRNDSHGLPSSNFEVYTNKKCNRNELTYTGERIPRFATAREYFTNLAQFSNQDFVSAGTNFDEAANLGYNLPSPAATTDVPVHTLGADISPEIMAECNTSTPCVMTFYSTSQTVTNPRASALSILDQYLKLRQVSYTDPVTSITYFKNRVFTLNKFTFDSAHPFLIPRAAAYSTGVLDYFFRGNIDMVADQSNPGKYMIWNLGMEDLSGDFALYYDAVDGNRYPVPGATWTNLTIAADSQVNNLAFMWPDNLSPQSAGEFTLVFKGTMGAEQAGFSSTGIANDSIGAVTARKVVLPCRSLSIMMATPAISVVSSAWIQGARTIIFDGFNHSPFLYSDHYTRTTTISVDGMTVGSVSEIQDNGSATSNAVPWGVTGASFSVSKQNNVMTEAQVVGLLNAQYFDSNGLPHAAIPSQYQTGAGYYLVNGSTPFFEHGNGTSAWVFLNGPGNYSAVPLPEYAAALALAAPKNQTVVLLSDGTTIASFPYTILDGSGHKANYPTNTTWTGNNWIDLYTDTNDGNGNWSAIFSQRVTFTVPQGVCAP